MSTLPARLCQGTRQERQTDRQRLTCQGTRKERKKDRQTETNLLSTSYLSGTRKEKQSDRQTGRQTDRQQTNLAATIIN